MLHLPYYSHLLYLSCCFFLSSKKPLAVRAYCTYSQRFYYRYWILRKRITKGQSYVACLPACLPACQQIIAYLPIFCNSFLTIFLIPAGTSVKALASAETPSKNYGLIIQIFPVFSIDAARIVKNPARTVFIIHVRQIALLLSTHIKYINGLTCKFCSTSSANSVNIFRKLSSTGIHSSKTA